MRHINQLVWDRLLFRGLVVTVFLFFEFCAGIVSAVSWTCGRKKGARWCSNAASAVSKGNPGEQCSFQPFFFQQWLLSSVGSQWCPCTHRTRVFAVLAAVDVCGLYGDRVFRRHLCGGSPTLLFGVIKKSLFKQYLVAAFMRVSAFITLSTHIFQETLQNWRISEVLARLLFLVRSF